MSVSYTHLVIAAEKAAVNRVISYAESIGVVIAHTGITDADTGQCAGLSLIHI